MSEKPIVPIYYFTKVKNVGDQLNVQLISWLFGRPAFLVGQDERHLLAIGSLMAMANSYSQVWGTGVLYSSHSIPQISGNNIHAVRGKLSYEVLRKNGIELGDIPLGDPAFLLSRVFPKRQKVKKFNLGIVAHYVDRCNPWVERMLSSQQVADLNVHTDPIEFLEKMDGCETVISSSLHGLICAEALGIPNAWIKLSENVLGDGFKFQDWFSLARVPQSKPLLPRSDDHPADLLERCILHEMDIESESLFEAFPFR